MKRSSPLLFLAVYLLAAPVHAAVYLGVGAGMVFTQGATGQIAAPIYGGVEAHFSVDGS